MKNRTFANAVIPIPQSRERNLAVRWIGAQGRLAGVCRRRSQSEIPLPRLRDRNDTGKGRKEP
jgi:hypothetical protein